MGVEVTMELSKFIGGTVVVAASFLRGP